MRRFLLCDDCLEFSLNFSVLLKKSYPSEFELVSIHNPATYLGDYFFDAYFLDIDMPDMSGFEFASTIRSHQENAVIIFVTSQSHLVYESFNVHPYDFIVKGCGVDLVIEKLNHLEGLLDERNRSLVIQHGSSLKMIKYSELIYMQKVHNDLFIKTTTSELRLRKSIKEIDKLLPKYFFKLDSGTIVNLHHVINYDQGTIVVSSNHKLMLNQRGKRLFKKAYLMYQNNRNA